MSFARYTKSLESEEFSLQSNTHIPLTVSATQDQTVDNTLNLSVTNPNSYAVKYKIKENDDLYTITYSTTSEEFLTIDAGSTVSLQVTIEGKDDVVYDEMQKDELGNWYETIDISLDEMGPYDATQVQIASGIKIYLQKSLKNYIIANAGEIVEYQENTVFSGPSSSSEASLCSIIDSVSGETIYFYRGNVTNNYVEFAGLTWRILRLNTDGSIRLILDDTASGVSTAYMSENTTSSDTIADVIDKIKWQNSLAYSTLGDWYQSNIINSGYDDYVVTSDYCFDTSYEYSESTVAGDCYYFGTYLRLGVDGNRYIPTFSTDNGLIQGKYGLITGDEILYAGGYWNQGNTSYFLYDGNTSWIMSPSFWDYEFHYKIGIMHFVSNGAISDWPSSDTVLEELGLRPVISIRGDLEMTGTGLSGNPYKYK